MHRGNSQEHQRADHIITTFLTDRLRKDDEDRQAKKARIESGGTVPTHDVEMEHTSASSARPTADEQRKRLEPRNTDDEELDRKKRLIIPDSSPMLDFVAAGDVDGEHDFSEMQGPHAEEDPDGQVKGELDRAKVREVREEELQELETRVYVEVDEAEAWKVSGKAPIGVRWVDVRKSTGEHRSRLVAQDFWPKSRVGDVEGLYAAMPPIELVKLVIAAAAERCRRGHLVKVMMIDIKKPTCTLRLREVYTWTFRQKDKSLGDAPSSMRQAARNWEKEYSKTLTDAGFVVGRANLSTFYHEMREVRIVVLRKKYPLKMRGILGPEPGDSKEAIILNRCVRWRDDGVAFEADRAHVEKILEATRMADCKANTVPATKEEHPDVDVLLEGEQCKAYRSAVDRLDIRFTTKELCRKMASPTARSCAGTSEEGRGWNKNMLHEERLGSSMFTSTPTGQDARRRGDQQVVGRCLRTASVPRFGRVGVREKLSCTPLCAVQQ